MAGLVGRVIVHRYTSVRLVGPIKIRLHRRGIRSSLPHRMNRVAFLTEFFPEIRPGRAAGFPEVDRNSALRWVWRWSVQCDVGELSRKVT